MSGGCNRLGLSCRARRTSVGLDTGGGAAGSGGYLAGIPGVVAQLSIDIPVNGAGFDLAGVGSGCNLVAPARPAGPAFVGEFVLVGSIVLSVDSHRPIPNTVRTLSAGRQLIASVGGIVIVSLRGSGGAVEYVEAPVGIGFVGGTGIPTVAAPVVPQIANNGIRINRGLIGCGFGSSYLIANFVIGGVGVAAGGEAGGPALDIGDLAGAGLLPFAADQRVAVQIGAFR